MRAASASSEILSDLLRAEGAHRNAASIRYRMTAARLPVVKDLDAFVFENTPINEGLVRSLHAGSFLPGRRNVVLRGGSVCLHSLAGPLSGSPAVDHAAARSGWLKYIWSGVLQPRLE